MKQLYNARKHPEVMQGKRSEDFVKSEFYESFEEFHLIFTGLSTKREPNVSLDEFMHYFTNLGFCIDSDELFSILMNNVWNISGNFDQEWTDGDQHSANMYRFMDDRRPGSQTVFTKTESS